MRVLKTALVAAVGTGLFLAPGASPAAAASKRCGPKGARTILATEDIRVTYKVSSFDDEDWTHACWRGRRAQLILGGSCNTDTGCGGPPHVVLAGRYVAYTYGECLRGAGCGATVGVRDLARRRSASVASTGANSLRVAPNGTAVWVEGTPSSYSYGTAPWSIRALTIGGATSTLGDGEGIDPYSLAVGGRFAYWMRGDQVQSAPVP